MRFVAFATLFVALLASSALANLPSPLTSTWDQDLGRSPVNIDAGSPPGPGGNPLFQFTFDGTLRNQDGQPVANHPASSIELRILAPCANPVTLNPIANSNAAGQVFWDAATLDQGGGSCIGAPVAAPVVEIHITGIGLFETLNQVVSPDQNGDGVVSAQDLSTFQQAFFGGPIDYQCDYTFDNFCTAQDLAFFQNHFFP